MTAPADVAARAAAVRAEIAAAAARAGRRLADICVIAVTKTLPPATVRDAIASGFTDVGENYVQEARDKGLALGATPGIRWHLIGGLQRNKARAAVERFDRIHTIDSAAVAEALNAEAGRTGRHLDVLMQVNVAADPRKRGVQPGAATALGRSLLGLRHLTFDGLMTIGPVDADDGAAHGHFGALRALRDDLARTLGVELPHLSMGMSADFVAAIEQGATFVRLGRVLFGERGGT